MTPLVTRREMILDEQGFAEMAAELRELAERSQEIERASAVRLAAAKGGVAEVDAGVVMMLFEGGAAPAAPAEERAGPRPRRRAAKRS